LKDKKPGNLNLLERWFTHGPDGKVSISSIVFLTVVICLVVFAALSPYHDVF
jgi:hypothetical protein